jgi:hypothetical protein
VLDKEADELLLDEPVNVGAVCVFNTVCKEVMLYVVFNDTVNPPDKVLIAVLEIVKRGVIVGMLVPVGFPVEVAVELAVELAVEVAVELAVEVAVETAVEVAVELLLEVDVALDVAVLLFVVTTTEAICATATD